MTNIIGLALFAVAGVLIYTAIAHRRKVLAVLGDTKIEAEDDDAINVNSLAIMGKIMPPIIVGILAIVGLKSVFMYFIVDAGRVFSLFDLAGFLALLVAYGLWIVFKTKYRMPVPAAPSASARSEAAQAPLRPTYQDG